MKTVAVFGGAFDPPHLGHAHVVRSLLDAEVTEEVWIVPSGERTDKHYASSANVRLEMVRALVEGEFAGDSRVQISDIEITNPIVGTVDLFETLHLKYPSLKFFFVCGEELLPDLPHWRSSEKLQKIPILSLPRGGAGPVSSPEGFNIKRIFLSDTIQLSSSQIRERVRRGESIRECVPVSVLKIIEDEKLFIGDTR